MFWTRGSGVHEVEEGRRDEMRGCFPWVGARRARQRSTAEAVRLCTSRWLGGSRSVRAGEARHLLRAVRA